MSNDASRPQQAILRVLVQILLSVCFCRMNDFPEFRLPRLWPTFPERWLLLPSGEAILFGRPLSLIVAQKEKNWGGNIHLHCLTQPPIHSSLHRLGFASAETLAPRVKKVRIQTDVDCKISLTTDAGPFTYKKHETWKQPRSTPQRKWKPFNLRKRVSKSNPSIPRNSLSVSQTWTKPSILTCSCG